jgi:hypothetical protein
VKKLQAARVAAHAAATVCTMCSTADAKYKCPTCFARYCSVACCKEHKVTPCSAPTTVPKPAPSASSGGASAATTSTADGGAGERDAERVSAATLARLEESGELRTLLRNEHLQHLLRGIDCANDSEALVKAAMELPVFVEFVDTCLAVDTEANAEADGEDDENAAHADSAEDDDENGDGEAPRRFL